jgi:hypothetical protein
LQTLNIPGTKSSPSQENVPVDHSIRARPKNFNGENYAQEVARLAALFVVALITATNALAQTEKTIDALIEQYHDKGRRPGSGRGEGELRERGGEDGVGIANQTDTKFRIGSNHEALDFGSWICESVTPAPGL